MENSINMDDLGVPLFSETSIYPPNNIAVSGSVCLTNFEARKSLAKHFSSRCLGSPQNTSGVLSLISEFDIIATTTKKSL